MNPFLSRLHADLRATRLTFRGSTRHLKPVEPGLHKEYPRMERIALPEPEPLATTLAEALQARRSTSSCDPDQPLTPQHLGTLFGLALRKHASGFRRRYPSGGGLYPVETYLIAANLEGQEPGVFHYHPSAHALERLWGLPPDFEIKTIARRPAVLRAPALIVFTALWERSSVKYGDLAYLHALIESGHMSENVLLVGTALGLGLRPYAGFADPEVTRLLDLDERAEQPIHSILVGIESPQGAAPSGPQEE